MRYRNRLQLVLVLLGGIFLLAIIFGVSLLALAPAMPSVRGPVLLSSFIVTLVAGPLCFILILRWLLRPYRQLVGEAERAPVSMRSGKARDEAEFVLETFQSVIAQLQAQQRELKRLSAQASARAASAEKFSERIVASVPSGLIAFNARGDATVVNAPARALIEADGEAEGRHVRSLLHGAPELAEIIEKCLRTGEMHRREEFTAINADGRVRRLGATVAPIDPEPEQGARGALCLLTDITEVTQLREQVALKRNLESLGEMSAGLAHEFKNALATLHGYAQLFQNLDLDERGRAYVSAMLQEVRGLSTMVTAFLNFARPQPLDLAIVPLRKLIEECTVELQAFYDERRVSLAVEGEFEEIHADERMMRQALLNILRNAAEAIDEDKAERRVKVLGAHERDATGKDWAIIKISDTGDGVPAADLQRIFIPFFTTKTKGHGVGLALAHRVVTDHGGMLTVDNPPTGGAAFSIKLPLPTS
ncbi:MAG TPA: ATP-binding protein [Pyrinomonadaceae bacterium]|nr:ATP-binding protein [Pyrinomonadaceae bacterium]